MKVDRKQQPEKKIDKKTASGNSLGEIPVGRLVIRMSLPAVFGVLAYNIYGILDTAFIAKGVGTDAAGGIAVSFPLLLFLSAVSSTLGSGCASVVSRALGEGNKDKAGRAAANTFGLFWLTALIVTVFGLLFLEELLKGMGVTKSLLPYARDYTKIILFGALTSTAFSSLIRAEGNSRLAMYVWVIPMAVNTLLDYLFILRFHWGVKGGAWATVIAQLVSVVMSMHYFFLSGKSTIKIRVQYFKPI